MLITDVRVVEEEAGVVLQAELRCDTGWMCDGRPFRLWYRFPHEWAPFISAERGDPFLAACLAPAMVLGEPLTIEAAVSPQLLRTAEEIQTILRAWNPRLHDVRLNVQKCAPPAVAVERQGNGLFFSLGVDSSYSLLKNLARHPSDSETITHLITVIGFDLYLRDNAQFPEVHRSVRRLANAFGKQHLVAWTNLREFSDQAADWPYVYHGAAAASIGLALGEAFGRIHIAATTTYQLLYPFGSHPLLDPLWSTETLRFIHDGCEANRMDKVRRIAASPLILEHLRVCVGDRGPEVYNCGRCWKCLMTMIALHIAGTLDRCPTLPHDIDPELLLTMSIPDQDCLWEEILPELGASPMEQRIKTIIAHELRTHAENA
jgi:hypothetical protein